MFLLPQSFWKIQRTVKKYRGVFAKKDIPPGSVIGDYIGILLDQDDVTYDAGTYDLIWDEDHAVVADPKSIGIHLINHSCSPNCAMFPYENHTLFFALRKILAGEELTISYMFGSPEGLELDSIEACHCQSPVCRGTFFNAEEYNERYDDFMEKMSGAYLEKLPAKVGELVTPLSHYPEVIADYEVYDLFANLDAPALPRNNIKIPPKKELRRIIRETGQKIYFPHLNITVYGIMNGLLIGIWDSD